MSCVMIYVLINEELDGASTNTACKVPVPSMGQEISDHQGSLMCNKMKGMLCIKYTLTTHVYGLHVHDMSLNTVNVYSSLVTCTCT